MANKQTVIAQWDYTAQEDDELSFSKGDTIIVLKDEDKNGWCRGRLEKNKNVGWFNIAYINTDPGNVNRICFCHNPLTKYSKDYPMCLCCCKKYEPNETEFYWCSEQCVYRKTTTTGYIVCTECYETPPDITSDANENEHNFMMKKFEETLKIIS
eukprot:229485_1